MRQRLCQPAGVDIGNRAVHTGNGGCSVKLARRYPAHNQSEHGLWREVRLSSHRISKRRFDARTSEKI